MVIVDLGTAWEPVVEAGAAVRGARRAVPDDAAGASSPRASSAPRRGRRGRGRAAGDRHRQAGRRRRRPAARWSATPSTATACSPWPRRWCSRRRSSRSLPGAPTTDLLRLVRELRQAGPVVLAEAPPEGAPGLLARRGRGARGAHGALSRSASGDVLGEGDLQVARRARDRGHGHLARHGVQGHAGRGVGALEAVATGGVVRREERAGAEGLRASARPRAAGRRRGRRPRPPGRAARPAARRPTRGRRRPRR